MTAYERIFDTTQNVDITDFAAYLASSTSTVNIPANKTISQNLTIPSACSIKFVNGSKFVHTTYTINFVGGLVGDPLHKIFDGTGAVTFSQGSVPWVRPEWWGLAYDSDCTAAVQKALNSLVDGGVLLLSAPSYVITGPLTNTYNAIIIDNSNSVSSLLSASTATLDIRSKLLTGDTHVEGTVTSDDLLTSNNVLYSDSSKQIVSSTTLSLLDYGYTANGLSRKTVDWGVSTDYATSDDKWVKVAEITLNGEYATGRFSATVFGRAISTQGKTDQKIVVHVMNGSSSFNATYIAALYTTVSCGTSTSTYCSFKDINVVHRSGFGITNNVIEIWLKYYSIYQSTVYCDVVYIGNWTFIETKCPNYETEPTGGYIALYTQNAWAYSEKALLGVSTTRAGTEILTINGTDQLIYLMGNNDNKWVKWSGNELKMGSDGYKSTRLYIGPSGSTDGVLSTSVYFDWASAIPASFHRWLVFGNDSTGYIYGYADDGSTINTKISAVTSSFFNVGNLGIGTTTPEVKLDIVNGSDSSSILYVRGADATSEYMGVGIGTGLAYLTAGSSGSDNVGLVLRTANAGTETERMRITSDGNVGIGTTIPGVALHVVGSIRSDCLTASKVVVTDENKNLVSSSVEASDIISGSGTENYLAKWLTSNSQGNSIIFDNGTGVGIGTTNPTDKLHIMKGISGATAISSNGLTIENSSTASINLLSTDTTSGVVYFGTPSNNQNASIISNYNSGSPYLVFRTNGANERMRITYDGKVGIGTDTPLTDVEIRPDTDETVKLTITGDKSISAVGDEYCSVDFRSGGDTSPQSDNDIVGRIVSVAEIGNGAYAGMAFYTTDSVSAPYIKERVRIDHLGNVGIGTDAPGNKLEIVNGSDATSILVVRGADAISEFMGVGVRTGVAYLSAGSSGTDNVDLVIMTASAGTESERMRITYDGLVGIGVTQPQAKMQIGQILGGTFGIIAGNNVSDSGMSDNTRKYLRIGVPSYDLDEEPVSIITVDNNDSANILHIGGGTSAGNASTEINFRTATLNTIIGTLRMIIDSDGKVGIGTGAPLTDVEIRPATDETVKLTITGDKSISAVGDEFCSLDFRSGGDTSPGSDNDITARIVSVSESGTGAQAGIAVYTCGLEGSSYLSERVRITNDGKVGIGTDIPSSQLHVIGNINVAGSIYVIPGYSFYSLGISTGSATSDVNIDGSYKIFKVASSKRYKENIRELDISSSLLQDIELKRYTWKNNETVSDHCRGKEDFGFIAEQVAEVCSELANYNEAGEVESWKTQKVLELAVAELQRLNRRIEQLEESLTQDSLHK
jgi:hypothetical protein